MATGGMSWPYLNGGAGNARAADFLTTASSVSVSQLPKEEYSRLTMLLLIIIHPFSPIPDSLDRLPLMTANLRPCPRQRSPRVEIQYSADSVYVQCRSDSPVVPVCLLLWIRLRAREGRRMEMGVRSAADEVPMAVVDRMARGRHATDSPNRAAASLSLIDLTMR